MEFRNLGRSGLQVPVAGLGCNNFGGRMDYDQTVAVLDKCRELGVTFLDTADVYGNRGLSEEFIGRALQGKRHEFIIATKFGSPMGEGPAMTGGSRRYIMSAVEASLRGCKPTISTCTRCTSPTRRRPSRRRCARWTISSKREKCAISAARISLPGR